MVYTLGLMFNGAYNKLIGHLVGRMIPLATTTFGIVDLHYVIGIDNLLWGNPKESLEQFWFGYGSGIQNPKVTATVPNIARFLAFTECEDSNWGCK